MFNFCPRCGAPVELEKLARGCSLIGSQYKCTNDTCGKRWETEPSGFLKAHGKLAINER